MPASGRPTRFLAALALACAFSAAAPLDARAGAPKDRAAKGAGAKSAEETRRQDEAYALFEESELRYREGEFRQAADLLRLAYKLDPEPTLLFNLGRALESAADLEGAVAAYRTYLDASPKAADRTQTERRVENLDRQIREKQALEAARLEEAHKREALERAVRANQGGGTSTQLAPDGSAGVVASVAPRSKLLPWVTVGLGGAAVATGTVLAVVALQTKDEAVNDPVQRSASVLADDAHGLEVGAAVGWVAGGVLLAGGLGWLLFGGDDAPSAPSATLSAGPSSLALTGRF